MMNKKIALFALAALPLQAFAEDAHFRLDGHLSTLGGGLEVGVPLTEKYDVRLGFNQFKFSTNQNSGGLAYKGDLKLSSVGALVDWRPWSGVAHLTAGLVFNGNKFALSATTNPGSSYTFNGATYTSAGGDTLASSVEFNKTVPYLGIGWSGNPKHKGFSFSSDLGIMFQGSPKASVTATGAWGGANIAQMTTDAQNQLNTDLKNFKFYPVLSLGMAYAF